MRRVLYPVVLLLSLLWVRPGEAQARDPWFGRDKLLHATSGFTLQTTLRLTGLSSGGAFVVCVAGGGLVEAYQAGTGRGDPSARDFLATTTGCASAWLVDHLRSRRHPR